MPSKVTGTMHVEIPADATKEELEQIQKVLQQTIAQSLGVPLEDIELKVDPATGEVTYVINTDDPSLADKVQKKLNTDNFAQNINETLVKNAESLPERIRAKLEIKDVKVNYFFYTQQTKISNPNSFSDFGSTWKNKIGLYFIFKKVNQNSFDTTIPRQCFFYFSVFKFEKNFSFFCV